MPVLAIVGAVAVAGCASDGSPLSSPSRSGTVPSSTAESTPRPTSPVIPTVTTPIRPGFVDALGSSDRVCVDVDHIVGTEDPVMGVAGGGLVFDIRSGQVLAGNFEWVVGGWPFAGEEEGVAKIYWIPLDRGIARTEAIEVVVEPLNAAGPPETWMFGGDGSWATAYGGFIWLSGIRFPAPGPYRLTASADGHWGCFELTV